MPRGATCSRTSKAITIVGGSTPPSATSPQSRQTGNPHNPVSTFPGKGHFLGYTFGRMYSPVTGKARLGYRPSKKSLKRMVERVHALTVRAATWQETTRLVDQ